MERKAIVFATAYLLIAIIITSLLMTELRRVNDLSGATKEHLCSLV